MVLARVPGFTKGTAAQLYDHWLAMARKAQATDTRCQTRYISQSRMNTTICQLMERIAKSDEIAQPGSLLEVAQQTIGTETGAIVTILNHRHGHGMGNTVTFRIA